MIGNTASHVGPLSLSLSLACAFRRAGAGGGWGGWSMQNVLKVRNYDFDWEGYEFLIFYYICHPYVSAV